MKNIPNCEKVLFEIKNDEHNQGEQRYCVENADGQRMFLRVSPKEVYDGKKIEHEIMERIYNLGVPTSRPIDLGFCNDGENAYSLTSWIDGEDLDKVIHLLTEAEQYAIGCKAGLYLQLINSIPAGKTPEEWEIELNGQIDWTVQEYLQCENRFADEKYVLDYLTKNRHLLKNRPQSFLHYDYALRNIMLVNKTEPYVIDYADYGFGDPWREFWFTFWSGSNASHYLTGVINGYFNYSIPELFFPTLRLYVSISMLRCFIYDGIDAGEKMFSERYNYLGNSIPAWYLSDYAE